MKQTITTLASLTIAASAFAHAQAIPHTHNGVETNWTPIIAFGAAVAVGFFVILKIRKTAKQSK